MAKLPKVAPVAKESNSLISDLDRFYFILAIGITLFAGDLVWWEAQTANDYLQEQQATITYTIVSDPDKREIINLQRELEMAEEELQQFIAQDEAAPQ